MGVDIIQGENGGTIRRRNPVVIFAGGKRANILFHIKEGKKMPKALSRQTTNPTEGGKSFSFRGSLKTQGQKGD